MVMVPSASGANHVLEISTPKWYPKSRLGGNKKTLHLVMRSEQQTRKISSLTDDKWPLLKVG
jgi:hypothetical protein